MVLCYCVCYKTGSTRPGKSATFLRSVALPSLCVHLLQMSCTQQPSLALGKHPCADTITDNDQSASQAPAATSVQPDLKRCKVAETFGSYSDGEAAELKDDPKADKPEHRPQREATSTATEDETSEGVQGVARKTQKAQISTAYKKQKYQECFGHLTPEDALCEYT